MRPLGTDQSVSTQRAQQAIERSGDRVLRAAERSASSPQEAAALSKSEFKAQIAERAGTAEGHQNLDFLVFKTAAKIAKARNRDLIGENEVRQAVGLWKGQAAIRAGNQGVLEAARNSTASSLKAIYLAAKNQQEGPQTTAPGEGAAHFRQAIIESVRADTDKT